MTLASQAFLSISVLLVQCARGDLGAALRQHAQHGSAGDQPQVLSQITGPLVVPLQKVDALPLPGHAQHTKDSFYVGTISVGHPAQEMKVLFDTASGHVLLPHRACKSPACLEHRRYSPWESTSATDVNEDGHEVQNGMRLAKGVVNRTQVTVEFTQSDLGSGLAKGVLVRDDVCIAGACTSLSLLVATHLDDKPFRAMPHDGLLGLALEGLSAGALSSFYERLMDGPQKLLPHFGLFLGETGGEIAFGGHDASRLGAPITWLPVERPEEGFWQVHIRQVRAGNVTVDRCLSGCRGIIDSGSSSLGMQGHALQRLRPRLRTEAAPTGCVGPDLELDLGGFVLKLTAQDYTGEACEPELGLLDLDPKVFQDTYALGTTVLRHYYTAFDWASAQVGFAPLATRSAQQEQVVVV